MALKFVPKHIIALQCAGDARPVHIKVSGFVCVSPDGVFCLADVMSTHTEFKPFLNTSPTRSSRTERTPWPSSPHCHASVFIYRYRTPTHLCTNDTYRYTEL